MSWTPDGTDNGNRMAFAKFKCKVCSRTMITNGSPPQTPCVCSPAPRAKKPGASQRGGRHWKR